MPTTQTSTLLLTLLLAIGLIFFLRAASKDRTTVVEVHSPRPALEVMDGLCAWLEERGWIRDGGDAERCLLEYRGSVASSHPLAVLLSILGGIGAGCLGLVLRELNPSLGWWPVSLILLGPLAGWVYSRRAARQENIQIRLIEPAPQEGSTLRLRAPRVELIANKLALGEWQQLSTAGCRLSSPTLNP